jgi:death-on-curing protein
MRLLDSKDIFNIHEKCINPHELQGLAANKSLDAVINRVENHMLYGIIRDKYDLAATYAVVIAVGHVFHDANKRTAFIAMDTVLRRNDVILRFEAEEIGQIIIKVAKGLINEIELADYLRSL